MEQTLALFDVDGTLLKANIGPRHTIQPAIKNVYGISTNLDFTLTGMTDQLIILGALEDYLHQERIMEKIKECMDETVRIYLDAIKNNDYIVELFNGVSDVLNELRNRKIAIGLATGNLERIAEEKMKKAGLDGFIDVGSYGSDAIERSRIIEIATERANRKFNCKFGNVVYIGDTPYDIEAAKAVKEKQNLTSIAVATGKFSYEELKKEEPDYLFNDLSNTERIVSIIQNNTK